MTTTLSPVFPPPIAGTISAAFDALQREAYENSAAHGFWDFKTDAEVVAEFAASTPETPVDPDARYDRLLSLVARARATTPPTLSEKIALQHSELSEVLEADRHRDKNGAAPASVKTPEFTQIEEEYADLLIRVFDTASKYELRLADAVLAKMAYNRTRPHKHGKGY